MTRGRNARRSYWPTLIGLFALIVIAIALAAAVNGALTGAAVASATTISSQMVVTDTPEASATSGLPPAKASLEEAMRETQAAAPQTPPLSSLATATLETGPSATPNFGDAPKVGAGIVITNMTIPPNWGRVAINLWLEIPKGIAVYAGGTDDPTQGALFILAPGENIDNPEEYLTPMKVGYLQVVDATNERLVLVTLTGSYTFYFDVPTRQFVDSLEITSTAPTVTPLASSTPVAPQDTAQVPTGYPMVLATAEP